jgi:beta-lactamase superfamily II metal-dependent hydrolase
MTPIRVLTCIAVLLTVCLAVPGKQKTLDIYFIDVEGGSATLIVTPLGESLLVDSGFPGERDAERIAKVAKEIAKLRQIDFYITTHWHRDHVGGSTKLAELIPIKTFYDHGLPTAPAQDIQPEYIDAYRKLTQGTSKTLKALDEIKFRSQAVRLRVLASNGLVPGEPSDAPQIVSCGTDFKPVAEDKSDNAKSIAILLTFGRFKYFNGGDLTWNVENKLVCPRNLTGAVDVYQVNHHGMDSSNNPTLVRALDPQVAVINNGPRKGGEVRTFSVLKENPKTQIYQLHRNVQTSDKDNASPEFVANDEEACQANFIKLSVATNGRYSVSIPAKGISRSYQAR